MSTESPVVRIPAEEYERRRVFLEGLKGLTRAEHIEIVRILQRFKQEFSENANGIFFNAVVISQECFDALTLFLDFTATNRKNLAEREVLLSTLQITSP
jgi:hypothetical protein